VKERKKERKREIKREREREKEREKERKRERKREKARKKERERKREKERERKKERKKVGEILHSPSIFNGSEHFQINTSFSIFHILLTLFEQLMPFSFFTAFVPYASDSTAHFTCTPS
jgi:hypothetical protein